MASKPPLSLAWLVHVRDNENLTVYEFALGSLYATCGEGKRIFLSDKGAADVLSIRRDTVAAARRGLLAKGLIEDTGQHGSQPRQREYRLVVPARGDGPQTGTPCIPNGHPHVSETGIRVVLKRAQHQEGYQEVDQEAINITDQDHDDGGFDTSSRSKSKADPPAGPGQDDPQDEDEDQPWIDWDSPDSGGALAAWLGVPVTSIGQPFRAWLEDYLDSVEFDYGDDLPAVKAAAEKAAGAENPVGYFQTIFPNYVAKARMKREQAARERAEREAEQAARERAERELWESTGPVRDKILATITGDVPPDVRPLGSVYVRSVRDAPNLQDVWYHPEFRVCFPHSRHNPGPDWRVGFLPTSKWNKVVAQDRIPLRRATIQSSAGTPGTSNS